MNARSAVIVRTQADLDAAIAEGAEDIEIRSERGVWIEIVGSASVSAFDSASVRAFGSASVRAFESASVRAFESASVRAFGSASVRAFGSASVSAFGSASVSAFDSASVSAFDSASVRATPYVAVHLHSGLAQIEGGVLIDHTAIDTTEPAAWATYHGATTTMPADGPLADVEVAVLYKAVRDDLNSAHGFAYPIGELVTCPDWRDDTECGHGLHFSPDPHLASDYDDLASRWLECHVPLAELRTLTGFGPPKCKAPRAHVVREVDAHARPVTSDAGVSA